MKELLSSSGFWTAAGAFAAMASAAVAAVYTWLTYRLVKGQIEPNVVIYVRHDQSRPTIIQIVIANIGRGLASDVRFETSRQIPDRAFGMDTNSAPVAQVITHGPLINGIPTLGPSDSRIIDWGQFGGLKKNLAGEQISVTINYKHGSKKMPPVTAVLEVESFEGTSANDTEMVRAVKALEMIGVATEKLAKSKN